MSQNSLLYGSETCANRHTGLSAITKVPVWELFFRVEELRHVAELLVTSVNQFFDSQFFQFRKVLLQSGIEERRRGFVVEMSSAFGLGNNAVNAAQLGQVVGGDTQGLSGQLLLGGIAPHDGGATLGRNHGIDGVFH